MPNHRALATLAVATLLGLAACAPTRRLPEGAVLLNKNSLVVDDRSIDKAALQAIIKQKPNKRVLGYRFYLQMWNLPDASRIDRWRQEKNARRDRQNEKRVAKGKEAKPYKITWAEWFREVVGEAPVVVDTALTARSRMQLQLYLRKEGWFEAEVADTLLRCHRRWFSNKPGRAFKQPKAHVVYTVKAGEPWHIRTITQRVDDPAMMAILAADTIANEVHEGDRFSAEALDRERTRTANLFKEEGYLYFTRDLVVFDAPLIDSTRQVDIVRTLERAAPRGKNGLAGTAQGTRQSIRSVTIDMSRTAPGWVPAPPDTLHLAGYRFLYSGKRPEFKPHALLNSIFLEPGGPYRLSRNDRTYRRLSNLNVFDRIDITYDSTAAHTPGLVDAYIDVVPAQRQSIGGEPFLTNRGGALGTSVNFSYRHRNLFRSMTSVLVQLNVGLEAQRKIVGNNNTAIGNDLLFNTVEVAPELTIRLPKALLIDPAFKRSNAARTTIATSFSYQRRPEYTRTLARGAFGWEWNETRTKTWQLTLLELNLVKIPTLDAEFRDYLQESADPVLIDSYTDHVIFNIPKITYTINTQTEKNQRNAFYYRVSGELAGSLLRVAQDIFNTNTTATDSTGNEFQIVLGVRYAEYVKLDNDLRFYHRIHEKSNLAFRVAVGAARPYANLDVMPFETSFFVGGANGLRAWRSRSVGPGSYTSPLVAYDRTGDIRIEGNAEYRFKLIGYLEGALFTDIGNIWYWSEDPLRPGSGFQAEDFLSELAVGTGIGARLNFDFFIIRFDLGLQMKDPGLPEGQRWIFEPRDAAYDTRFGQKLVLNLGINYPF